MGCFLACFGFSDKRNRRKPAHKRHGSYEPLDSAVTILSLDNADSEPRHKPKDRLSSKIRKKVSFNLNVQIYEPISTEYQLLSDQENEESEETARGSLSTSQPANEGHSNWNYRYQNCRDLCDEEDDIAFEDSDLDDFVDDNGESDVDSRRENQDGILKRKDSSHELVEEKVGSDEIRHTHSVLKPVENLSQWRAAKAAQSDEGKHFVGQRIPSARRGAELQPVQATSTTNSGRFEPFELVKFFKHLFRVNIERMDKQILQNYDQCYKLLLPIKQGCKF